VLQALASPARVKRRRKIAVRFDGVDMRSRRAHRLKAILADLIGEFGDDANLDKLREIAVHRVALEQMQADALAGKMSAVEQSVRLANAIARARAELRSASRKSKTHAPPGQALGPLVEHFSRPREAAT